MGSTMGCTKQYLHPDFTITGEMLNEKLEEWIAASEKAHKNPPSYEESTETIVVQSTENSASETIVVHPPDENTPETIVAQTPEENTPETIVVKSIYHEIAETIVADSGEFLEGIKIIFSLPQEFLILVDKKHNLDNSYEPQDLVLLTDYSLDVTKKTLTLRKIIMDDLTTMIQRAQEETIHLTIASAYRSYGYQARVYDYWKKELGKERADLESARPGHSQHQLGTTLDFYPIEEEFAQTAGGQWMAHHASSFGFSLSYPGGYETVTGYIYEPWHYRYVGKETTYMIDRYFKGIQQFFLEFYHEYVDFFRSQLVTGKNQR